MARQPYPRLVECSSRLAQRLGQLTGQTITDDQIIFDAPPVGLEVQFNIDVMNFSSGQSRKLGDISPVVQTLAQEQFDNFVKQVRIFLAPELISTAKAIPADQLEQIISESIH